MHPQLDKINQFIRVLDEASLEALKHIALEKKLDAGRVVQKNHPAVDCRFA